MAANASQTIGENCEFLALPFNVCIALFTHQSPFPASGIRRYNQEGGGQKDLESILGGEPVPGGHPGGMKKSTTCHT